MRRKETRRRNPNYTPPVPKPTMVEKYGKGKCMWALFALLSVIAMAMMVIAGINHRTIRHNGNRLRLVSVDQRELATAGHIPSAVVMADRDGNHAILSVSYSGYSTTFTASYLGNVTTREFEAIAERDMIYTFSDSTGWTSASTAEGLTPLQRQERDFIRNLLFFYLNYSARDYIVFPLVVIGLILVGLVHIFYDKALWRLSHMAFVKNGEPTDFALISCKGMGFMLIVVSFILCFFMVVITA